MRPALLLSFLASTSCAAAIAPSSAPAPLVAAEPAASTAFTASAPPAPSRVTFEPRRLRFAGCDVAASLPVIAAGTPAGTQRIAQVIDGAVEAWVAAATDAGCPAEGALESAVTYEAHGAHGLVQVRIAYPLLPMEKFSNADSYTFVMASGEHIEAQSLFVADRMDDLRLLLAAAYERAYHHRDDCREGGFGVDPSSAVLAPDGLELDDWTSIPMAEKNCGGTRVVIAYAAIASYLRPDLAALLGGRP